MWEGDVRRVGGWEGHLDADERGQLTEVQQLEALQGAEGVARHFLARMEC